MGPRPDLIEFFGNISLLKAGLVYADALSTVSPRYAQEIQTPEQGFALDGLSARDRTSLRDSKRRRLHEVEPGDGCLHPRTLFRDPSGR